MIEPLLTFDTRFKRWALVGWHQKHRLPPDFAAIDSQ